MSLRALKRAARTRPYTMADLIRAGRDPSRAAGSNPDLTRIVRFVNPEQGVLAVKIILSLDEDEDGWKRHASMAAHDKSGDHVRVEPYFFEPLLGRLGFGSPVRAWNSDNPGKEAVWHFYEPIEDPRGRARTRRKT